MTKYIVDASVILRSLLLKDSATHQHFKKVLQSVEAQKSLLFAPTLLWSEVGNGLRFSVTESATARQKFHAFNELPFLIFDLSSQHHQQILQLAYQLETTVYDTTYHQIALLIDGVFLTSDESYFKKAKDLGSIQLI